MESSKGGTISIRGDVRYYQTDDKTGLLVPGTYKEEANTIFTDLQYYLMYKIGTDTTDYAMDSLFPTGRAVIGTDIGEDGIVHADASTGATVDYVFDTDLNDGGDEVETYIEYYGTLPGAATLNGYLQLGQALIGTPYELSRTFAYYDINETVAAGRTFHFYWKISLS